MTVANKITITRAFLAFIMFGCIIIPSSLARFLAMFLFAVAALTDIIDGKIARRTNTVTVFGAIADPFVDKILVSAAFLGFAVVKELDVPMWAVFLMLAREMTISTLRILAAAKQANISAERSGKFKTAIQFVSASIILIILNLHSLSAANMPLAVKQAIGDIIAVTAQFPHILTIASMAVAVTSGIMYIKGHWKILSDSWDSKDGN